MPYMVKPNHGVHKDLHKARKEFLVTSVSSLCSLWLKPSIP
ncbi:hypothetical protein EV194_10836 [Natronoflexus pectinivorans]|uniref:Uncharacterized protein n=1 Tax=Natronoflexus pectinivorans TaxID=682526 RepID=A0A4R2GH59_9BACT|nr:hypothetical protein EV194_10836 [Natronoflexus pectinivorans]